MDLGVIGEDVVLGLLVELVHRDGVGWNPLGNQLAVAQVECLGYLRQDVEVVSPSKKEDNGMEQDEGEFWHSKNFLQPVPVIRQIFAVIPVIRHFCCCIRN